MVLRDIAKAFGVSVSELAKIVGYSRQALYDMADSNPNRGNRTKQIASSLREHSQKIYEEELLKAKHAREERDRIADKIEKGNWSLNKKQGEEDSIFLTLHLPEEKKDE